MKKFVVVLALIFLFVLMMTVGSTVQAGGRPPDFSEPATSEANNPSYWEDRYGFPEGSCHKKDNFQPDPDGGSVTLSFSHRLIVVKAAGFNYVWEFTAPGTYYTGEKHDESHTIWCDVPSPPEGEKCGRCSNAFVGWVEWYDRDGGCDDDFYNERVEYPYDERCYENCQEGNTEKVQTSDSGWYNVGPPYGFGDWVEEEGSLCIYGFLDQERDLAGNIVDKNSGVFCDPYSQKLTQTVEAKHCEDECSEDYTEWLPKVFGDWYPVNGPEWGDWYDPLNGISYRNGVQAIARDWTQDLVDTRNGAFCDVRDGTEEDILGLYEERCSPRWTGEWIITIRQAAGGTHYRKYCTPYVPDAADTDGDGRISEKEAKAWVWSDAYLADLCALDCETQDWKAGEVLYVKREFKTCDGFFVSGNHCTTDVVDGDVCEMLEEIRNGTEGP